jgi:hypothetical protein
VVGVGFGLEAGVVRATVVAGVAKASPIGLGVGVATKTGATDVAGLGAVTGVTAATEGVGVGITEVDPDPQKRIAPKIAKTIIKTPPKSARTISLRLGGGAGDGEGGSADGIGVTGDDTGTLAGRPAAAMFSLSARQNSAQLGKPPVNWAPAHARRSVWLPSSLSSGRGVYLLGSFRPVSEGKSCPLSNFVNEAAEKPDGFRAANSCLGLGHRQHPAGGNQRLSAPFGPAA